SEKYQEPSRDYYVTSLPVGKGIKSNLSEQESVRWRIATTLENQFHQLPSRFNHFLHTFSSAHRQ
ncbi:hypothetical protein AVEN_136819-1, partial [Araneus ventricosus]